MQATGRAPRLAELSESAVCNMLLSMRADTDLLDKRGCGALHYATLMGWEEGVKLLLKAKADITLLDSVSTHPTT